MGLVENIYSNINLIIPKLILHDLLLSCQLD